MKNCAKVFSKYILINVFKLFKIIMTFFIYYLGKLKPSTTKKYLVYILLLVIFPFILDSFFTINRTIFEISIELFSYIIDVYIRFISLSIPVVLAFSYFIYREQQGVSLRHRVFVLLFTYFVISIPGLILAVYVNSKIILIQNQEDFNVFVDDFYKVILITILMILKMFFLPYFIGTLLKIISITNQFNQSISGVFKNIKLLYNIRKSKKKSIYFFENAHNHLESIFQSFEYALVNKIDRIFTGEFNRLSEIFLKIMDESPFLETVIFSQRLTLNHPKGFRQFYQYMVNNMGKLIFSLYHNNKELEMRKAIQILKDIEPNKVPELYPIYFQELESIAVRSLKNNDLIFERVLSLLEEISEPNKIENSSINDEKFEFSTNAIGVLLIYQSMLKVAVEENDVNRVTSITYSMNRFVSSNVKESDNLNREYNNQFVEAIQLSIFESLKKIMIQRSNPSVLVEITLFILFQGALKSIEIGSYGATGQLIKRITTDFQGKK